MKLEGTVAGLINSVVADSDIVNEMCVAEKSNIYGIHVEVDIPIRFCRTFTVNTHVFH